MKKIIVLFALCFGILCADEIEGVYLTHIGESGRQSVVEFFEKNNKIYAYGFANVDGSAPKKDSKNPNPRLRDRVDKGSVFIYGLKKDKNGVYSGGRAYNYDDGKTYFLKITRKSNGILILYVSIDFMGFVGQSFIWTPLTKEQQEYYESQKPDFKVVLESFEGLPKVYK